jgi:hypothetical protein
MVDLLVSLNDLGTVAAILQPLLKLPHIGQWKLKLVHPVSQLGNGLCEIF